MPTPPAAPPPLAAPDSKRLRLKPVARTTALVDGGWWPESRDLTAVLPALLSALSLVIGRVALVGYHRSGWDAAPDHLDTAGGRVLLQGWTADVPHSVVAVADSGQRVALLVVPPESTQRAAQVALSDACAPNSEPGGEAEACHSADRSMAETIDRIITLERATEPADRDRITRWVDEADQQFVGAPVQIFVPILIEHIVRSRLAARR